MTETADAPAFEHTAGFTPGEVSGGFGLGPLELSYEELFADALADGVITAEERAQLDKAADNLGLDRQRLLRLEQAMVAAYQQRHRVKVVEHYEEPVASLAPLQVEAAGDAGRMVLLKRVEQLEARVAELEEELRRAQAAINVEVDLGDLEASVDADDPEDVWRRVRRDPTSADAVRALHRAYAAHGADPDKLWCTSQLLALVGAASADQRAHFERHRTHGLIAPKSGVSQHAWHDLLFHPEEEVLTGVIFGIIAPAVLLGRVTAMRRDGQLHVPSAADVQDPTTSTATSVRALSWASAILGLAAPRIVLEKGRDCAYQLMPGVPPYTVVGKGALSGRSQPELAFLAGRHLTAYRQEHFVRSLFSAVPDLEDLFLAALTIGNPGLPIAEGMKRRVAPIAEAIRPVLEPQHVDALRGHFLRFVEEGGRTNLQRWTSAVEKTSCRAGLLLGNDLASAVGLLEAEEGAQGDLALDLCAFSVSERYFKLRKQLGIALV
ncbi:MAG: hypothetical protein IT376_23475 [Polyangiaceae bacterium]|nr:hypothetical protein [Polyangiaceae bacterium]